MVRRAFARAPLAIAAAAVAASLAAGCGTTPTPTPSPAGTQSAAPPPTAAPSPTPAPSASTPPVSRIVPPRVGTPEGEGIAGLDWAMTNEVRGYGTVLAKGPAGWLSMLAFDGEIPSTPDLRLSADLTTWTDVTPADPVITCGDNGSLAATPDRYVLACAGGAWHSGDGRAWQEIDAAAAWGDEPGAVPRVTADGSGFLAWIPAPAAPTVWVSEDGAAWRAVTLPGAGAVLVDTVAGRLEGGFVVAGRAGDDVATLEADWANATPWSTYPGVQAVWTAPAGGESWTRLPMGEGWESSRIASIAADGPNGGLVAAGLYGRSEADTNQEPIPAVWRSVLGETWDRLDGPAFGLLDASPGSTRVVATPERWLVIGSRPTAGAMDYWDVAPVGVVAGSEDGGDWWMTAPIALGGGAYAIEAAVVDGTRVVLLTPVADVSDASGLTRTWVSPP